MFFLHYFYKFVLLSCFLESGTHSNRNIIMKYKLHSMILCHDDYHLQYDLRSQILQGICAF